MPRKRAKHSVRVANRDAMEHDLPPDNKRRGEWGDMPRRAIELFRGPPPKKEAAPAKATNTSIPPMHIRPGERLSDFNQRVEQEFAHDIYASMRTNQRSESNQKKRQRRRDVLKAKKRAASGSDDDDDDESAAQRDFARAPSSRSLHDVALAPPTITARPKERRPTSTRPKPSPARQRILDEERQRVIELYRAQKRA